jgi:hypothetical protein
MKTNPVSQIRADPRVAQTTENSNSARCGPDQMEQELAETLRQAAYSGLPGRANAYTLNLYLFISWIHVTFAAVHASAPGRFCCKSSKIPGDDFFERNEAKL